MKPLAKNYRLVHDVLREQPRGTHLRAADVAAAARRRHPRLGLTTVYRALARLCATGLVSEISVPGADGAVYEAAGEAHAHFRCDRCGRVDDIPYVLPAGVVDELARIHDFEAGHVMLSLHGTCAHCKARTSPVA